jgi:peptidoglycan/LPS O-acetylase OafA/YrhL
MLFPERRRFRLIPPSSRTILAAITVAAFGTLVSIAYMIINQKTEGFTDLLYLTLYAAIITFITAYASDYLSHE